MHRVALIAVLAALLAGCGGSGSSHGTTATASTASPFADPAGPLKYVDRGKVGSQGPLTVRDVSYSAAGHTVPGFLVVPPKRAGRVPAVLVLHGTGGDRTDFLPAAGWIAARGAVAMTITEPSSSAPAPPAGQGPQALLKQERALAVADVVAGRRAVDVLRSLPQVDPDRIGVLGWSAGARTGAVLAGAEPRIKAFVLMSAGAVPVSDYVTAAPPSLKAAVRTALTPIDPLLWVARGRPGTILLQDGRRDDVVPRRALVKLAEAAPKGTELRWYPAGHELNVKAERDQLAWLARKLPITGPPVAGARAGPSS